MSNNQMVLAPRELLERLDLGKNTAAAMAAMPELRDLLAKSADHIGETFPANITRFTPVNGAFEITLTVPGIPANWMRTPGSSVLVSDRAEVEWLRYQLSIIRRSCPDRCEVTGSVAGTAQNYIGELEQKLAEAHALLANREAMLINAAKGWTVKIFTAGQIIDGRTFPGGGMAFSVADGTVAVLDTSSRLSTDPEPAAFADTDERVKFDRWMNEHVVNHPRHGEVTRREYIEHDIGYDPESPAWEAWEARAALERKP